MTGLAARRGINLGVSGQVRTEVQRGGSRRGAISNEWIIGEEEETDLGASGQQLGHGAEDSDPNYQAPVENLYCPFTRKITTALSQNIPYRLVRGENADPR